MRRKKDEKEKGESGNKQRTDMKEAEPLFT